MTDEELTYIILRFGLRMDNGHILLNHDKGLRQYLIKSGFLTILQTYDTSVHEDIWVCSCVGIEEKLGKSLLEYTSILDRTSVP